jgi:hypothetical protein
MLYPFQSRLSLTTFAEDQGDADEQGRMIRRIVKGLAGVSVEKLRWLEEELGTGEEDDLDSDEDELDQGADQDFDEEGLLGDVVSGKPRGGTEWDATHHQADAPLTKIKNLDQAKKVFAENAKGLKQFGVDSPADLLRRSQGGKPGSSPLPKRQEAESRHFAEKFYESRASGYRRIGLSKADFVKTYVRATKEQRAEMVGSSRR